MTAPTPDHAQLLKRSLRAIDDLKARVATLEYSAREPIAIVGVACRLPGGANTPEQFWELVLNGTDAVTEVPKERWDADAYFDSDPDAPGKSYSRWGAFIDNVDQFAADFFGVSPREAIGLDPQQRLLLEVAWEALEHGGNAPARLMGSKTGVFIGMSAHDYGNRITEAGVPGDAYTASGNSHSMASGRLAYVLGFQGPNLVIDTACSSSIVATHLAVQSLRTGESDVALAAGVNLTITPTGAILTSRARMGSPTGRCHTFDAAADGYVRGEGCVVVALKRLSDAERDGDHIMALIRGSALNQDGRSSGLTAPFGPAQEAVIRASLADARLAASDVDFVEAHGTGTSLGDPIEIKALGETYGRAHSADAPLMVGSVKTNIGHLEGASGLAGLLKAVLALQHGIIPPHLHLQTPNPLIPWERYPITVPTTPTPWPRRDGAPRRAGVSSFGFSGTNGHLILEEAPARTPRALDVDRPRHLLPLSAHTPDALGALARRYADLLGRPDAPALADVAATAGTGRSHFPERLAVVATTIEEAREKLLAAADGTIEMGVTRGRVEEAAPEVVFLCTGQGAQYAGMARQLYDTQPAFRRAIDACAVVLDRELPRPLLSVLFPSDPDDAAVNDTEYTQPALFAVEYALAELWRAWGVEPSLVMGHSVGEYVAACLAGVFSLEDGLRLIAARGRLMGALPRDGAMAAIFADEARVRDALAGATRVSVAGVNGAQNTVISGDAAEVDAILNRFSAEGVEFQRLTVSHAFHSPLMDPILDAFEAVASTVTFHPAQIGIISNVTGAMAGPEIGTPGYWRRHVREAVRFSDSIATAYDDGYRVFLEIGPHATLIGMARRTLPPGEGVWLASLRKGVDEWSAMLDTLGVLYTRGFPIDWMGVDAEYREGRQRVVLPTYPFERRRFWLDITPMRASGSALLATPRTPHPLLGGALPTASPIYETRLSVATLPYLADHRIAGMVLFPGAGFLELALAAGRDVLGPSAAIDGFTIGEALVVPDEGEVRVQVICAAARGGETTFEIFSARESDDPSAAPEWRSHARGTIRVASDEPRDSVSPDAWRATCPTAVDVASYYETLEAIGADYGPTFHGITALHTGNGEVTAHIRLPAGTAAAGYWLHPALFDACMQATGAGFPGAGDPDARELYMPIGMAHVRTFAAAGTEVWCHATLTEGDSDTMLADLTLVAPTGTVVAEARGIAFKRIPWSVMQRQLRAQTSHADWVYEVAWRAIDDVPAPAPTESRRWLLTAGTAERAEPLAAALRAAGHDADVLVLDDPTAGVPALRALVAERLVGDGTPAAGVIHLDALDQLTEPRSLAALETAAQLLLSRALAVAQACGAHDARLCFVTRGAQPVAGSVPDMVQAPLWGFGGVVASEYPTIACTRVDLDPATPPHARGEELARIAQLLDVADGDDQRALRGGTMYVARLVPGAIMPPAAEPVRLEITQRGQLDRLTLAPMRRTPPGPGEIEIRVYATGLNFRDVLNALGAYPGDPGPLGNECAGVISAVGPDVTGFAVGDAVISMIDRSFASYAIAPANLTVPKPARLSFAQAATIPVTFLTADYALNTLGRMRAGDKVLIHAATGGVGMAALQLARRAGAEIFGTAGTPDKRALAEALGAHHVADSRSTTFADEFDRMTNGTGVDIALNSLAGDFIPRTLELLKPGGRFIEIGKTDVWDAERVAATYPGLEYHVLYLGAFTAADPDAMRARLLGLLADFESGALEPLPMHLFPLEQAVDAFRFMAQAKHTGKIVITQRHEPLIDPEGTHLVTGGLGGLGLTVAHWLADEGARYVALMGRRAPSTEAARTIDALRARGVDVRIVQGDVASADDVTRIVAEIQETGHPLRTVLHAAGVVDDGTVGEQTWPRMATVLAPKVAGTWNLHVATRDIPLDAFVMFSSGAAILGSPGQSNYAAANLFLDAFAHVRLAHGMPALSINWGSWSDVGMAAGIGEQHRRRWASFGLGMIAPEDGVRVMRQLMMGWHRPQAAVLPLNRTKLKNLPPFYRELVRAAAPAAPVATALGSASDQQLHARLSASPLDARAALVEAFLADQLIRVLALDSSYQVNPRRSIMEMGLDSLMAMELRNRINVALQVTTSVADLLLGPTVQQLASSILEKFVAGGDAAGGEPVVDEAALLADVDTLSDADLDAQLDRLLADARLGQEE